MVTALEFWNVEHDRVIVRV